MFEENGKSPLVKRVEEMGKDKEIIKKRSHKIWKNWCFGQFFHSKIEELTLSLSQFSLVTRKDVLHVFPAVPMDLEYS